MKTRMNHILGLLLIGTVPPLPARAQSGGGYALSWNSVDGGGGNCNGGKFTLSGTVGQPDAVDCTSGGFMQQGGFVPAFQKTVGPPLIMTRTMSGLNFLWLNSCAGFLLEGAPNVTGPWTELGSGAVVGSYRQLFLTAPAPYRFFRLRKDCPR